MGEENKNNGCKCGVNNNCCCSSCHHKGIKEEPQQDIRKLVINGKEIKQ